MTNHIGGRPTKYTEENLKIILDSIAMGMTQKDAAILAGIGEDTLSRWKTTKEGFADKLHQKEMECKQRNIALIQKAAKGGTWQAAAWWLERKYSDEFSLKHQVEHSGKDGEPLRFIIEDAKSNGK